MNVLIDRWPILEPVRVDVCGAPMFTVTEQPAVIAERRFFAGMAFASVAVVFAGFATSYYLWPLTRATHYPAGQPISASLPLIVHVHAIAFSAWVGLLVVQGRSSTRARWGSIGAWAD